MAMAPYRYTLKRITKPWRSKNVVTSMGLLFSVQFVKIFLSYLKRKKKKIKKGILKKKSSLKRGEGVPLLSFEGVLGSHF